MSETRSRYSDPADAALRLVVRRLVELLIQATIDPESFRGHFLDLCVADAESGDFYPGDGSDPEDARTAVVIALGDFLGATPPKPIMETTQ